MTLPQFPVYGFTQSYVRPFGGFPVVKGTNGSLELPPYTYGGLRGALPPVNDYNNYNNNTQETDLYMNFETAQKSFENARKKASSFKRDCFSLYMIEHQNDKTQNETYRHIATAYNSKDLKQIADQDDCGLYFIAPEVIAADGSRYTQQDKLILEKNYIPQDGFVYHSSAGVLFDIDEFLPSEPSLGIVSVFEKELENGDNVDDLSLSFFSQDSEDSKTLNDLSILFEEEDKRDWTQMAKNRNAQTNIRNNTIDAYQNVRLNEFFKKGFTFYI
jgi:hypothetical protein